MTVDGLRKELKDKAAAGSPTLGELVWWTLGGVEQPVVDVEALVDGLGVRSHDGRLLTHKDVCPVLQARGAVQKTLDELNIRSGSARRKAKGDASGRTIIARRYDARSSTDIKPGDFHVALVEEHLAPGARPTFREVQRIRYDSAARQIGLDSDLLFSEIHAGFRKYGQTYRSADLGRIISDLIAQGHGILARESGGVYFIPKQYIDVSQAVDKLCQAIPGACFTRMPILAGGHGEAHVVQTRELAGAAIRAELVKLQADMDELRAQAGNADAPDVRGSTLQRRLERYRVLRHKAQTYRKLLDLEDSAIKDQLNALVRAAKALMEQPSDPKVEAA